MFNKWRKSGPAKAEAAEPEGIDGEDDPAPAAAAPAPAAAKPAPAAKGGLMGLLLGLGIVTVLAGGLGTFLGSQTAATVAGAVAARAKAAEPAGEPAKSTTLDGDMVVQPVEAVVTNLAAPSNVWIRLETAVVFRKDAIENPLVMAAEIREDILAYARTVTLAQLEGPSALQHLREDLGERAALRTDGRVTDLVIQSLVVQ